VYDTGSRFSGSLFAAFCLREEAADGPRIGFTCPRALGKAVVRNRIKRRVREAVRLQLDRLSPLWSIVINPRRKALEAPVAELHREVERLILRCNGS
jgi:ribonuclease P protein component